MFYVVFVIPVCNLTWPSDIMVDKRPTNLANVCCSIEKKKCYASVMLDNAGHYPLEQPGLKQMENAIAAFVEEIVGNIEN